METAQSREPWNKGKLVGRKAPLKLKDIWAIRIDRQRDQRIRELALFSFALDSKLRGCDLANLRVRDVVHSDQVVPRAMVVQQKTQRPVQFERTEQTRNALAARIAKGSPESEPCLLPSRAHNSPHVSTRQYARIVHRRFGSIGLDPSAYGTRTMRRTKASLIYRRTRNLRAVQLLLGHPEPASTVRYLGIEGDHVLAISEQTETSRELSSWPVPKPVRCKECDARPSSIC